MKFCLNIINNIFTPFMIIFWLYNIFDGEITNSTKTDSCFLVAGTVFSEGFFGNPENQVLHSLW